MPAPTVSAKTLLAALCENKQLWSTRRPPASTLTPFPPLPETRTLSRFIFACEDAEARLIPSVVLSLMTEFLMSTATPLASLIRMPSLANLKITQSSMLTALAEITFMPRMPLQNPLMEMPRIVITSVAVALMIMPVVREARIEANVPVPSRVIDLVIVTAP